MKRFRKLRKVRKRCQRELLYQVFLLVRFLFAPLPRSVYLFLGAWGGRLAFFLLRRERKRTLAHLEKVFKDKKTVREQIRIGREVFENLGKNFFEWLALPYMKSEELSQLVDIEGEENIREVLKKGKGYIILTGHLGNWEFIPACLALKGFSGEVLVRKIYVQKFDRIFSEMRQAIGVPTIYTDESPRRILKVLRSNRGIGILGDQDVEKINGVFVPFLGELAYTPTAPVSLALSTGAGIVPLVIIRQGDRFLLHIEKPIDLVSLSSKEETLRVNTKKWCEILEKYILRYPEQWVWMHRRWKTKPKEVKSMEAVEKVPVCHREVTVGSRGDLIR